MRLNGGAVFEVPVGYVDVNSSSLLVRHCIVTRTRPSRVFVVCHAGVKMISRVCDRGDQIHDFPSESGNQGLE